MPHCLFAADLHGRPKRYEALIAATRQRVPAAVFLGGDLLPFPLAAVTDGEILPADFVGDYLAPRLDALRSMMGARFPEIFVIMGNDDPRADEDAFLALEREGLWHYCHNRWIEWGDHAVCGYSFVPPTPFHFKDWEKYDVSRYVPPGAVSPEEGRRSVHVDEYAARYETIKEDLDRLAADRVLDKAVFLFHTPPSDTHLDRIDTGGRMIDHVPLDDHVGSIAVRRFIEKHHPPVTLHGHIHESARITGQWRDRIGDTHCFSAAHDGPELALVTFDPADPARAKRELL